MTPDPRALLLAGAFTLGAIVGAVALGVDWAAPEPTARVAFVPGDDADHPAVSHFEITANGTRLIAKIPASTAYGLAVSDLFRIKNDGDVPRRVALEGDRASAALSECAVILPNVDVDLSHADPGAVVDVPARGEVQAGVVLRARAAEVPPLDAGAIVLRLWILE